MPAPHHRTITSEHPLERLLGLTSEIRLAEIARYQRWTRRHPVHGPAVDEAHLRMERALACIETEIRNAIAAKRDVRRLRTQPPDRRSEP